MRTPILLAMLVLWACVTKAATIHVPAEHLTIQAGVDAASENDTVLVADGIYSGPGNRDIEFADKNIVLMSANGPDVTTIDASGLDERSHRCINLGPNNGISTTISGFTLRGGHRYAPWSAHNGGGIHSYASSALIRNCIFTDNEVSSGGGIYAQASPLTIQDCIFKANSAVGSGGAIKIWLEPSPRIQDCRFEANVSDYSGGAIDFVEAQVSVIGCEFSGNIAQQGGGGGIRIAACSVATIANTIFEDNLAVTGGGLRASGSVEVVKCKFLRNQSTGGGGGVMIWLGSSATFTECEFSGNTTTNMGGGVLITRDSSQAHFTNCEFDSNIAEIGGGISCNYTCRVSVHDCRFTGNQGTLWGGGLWSDSRATVEVDQCTFIGNKGHGISKHSGPFFVSNSLFERNSRGGIWVAGASEGSYIRNCRFVENESYGYWGGGALEIAYGLLPIVACEFIGNRAVRGAAIFYEGGPVLRIDSCLFDSNISTEAGSVVFAAEPCSLFITNSTLIRNTDATGGLFHLVSSHLDIRNSIVAFNDSPEIVVFEDSGNTVGLECTDVFGNLSGDWVGVIEEYAHVDGNFSSDPLFCDTTTANFHLQDDSPCAPDNNECGVLVGAFPVGCIPTGVDDDIDQAALPSEFRLLQNYPNPFNPKTEISFTLPHAVNAELTIYNMLGQVISELVSERLRAGEHTYQWNGMGFASGVYFFRLVTDTHAATRKMVLLK